MMVDVQRGCDNQPSKTQAIKILIADFLLHEELPFSLSVLCTEVPDLLNLTQYNQYVSHLADPNINKIDAVKSKFNEKELLDVLEALNLNLKTEEFHMFFNIYKSGKTSSVLASLLGTIPKLIKKHRLLEYLLKRARKKEKKLQKLAKIEKSKVRGMYAVVQKAYGAVEKHKSDMREFLHNQNIMNSNEITSWQKTMEVTEHSLHKSYRNRCEEIEKRAEILEKREFELQSKYQKLEQSMNELKIEHERIKQAEFQLETAYVDENDKLQEFQQKFYCLQAEVQAMLETYHARESDATDTPQEPLADNEVLSNMEEYVNLMEKENLLLKVSSNEQRCHIDQLTNEISFLRSRLNHLENEMHVRKHIELEIQQREVIHALLLSSKRLHPKNCGEDDTTRESTVSLSRRKLFCEDENDQSSEYFSKIASEETNLTDEIVADAKNEVRELENESAVLNRNFKSLQNILTRNIALSESKNSFSSSLDGSSPRSSRLSRSYGELDYSNTSARAPLCAFQSSSKNAFALETNRAFEKSPPHVAQVSPSTRRFNSFRELFIKRKKERIHSMSSGCTVAEDSSSVFSSPREKIDDDESSNEVTPRERIDTDGSSNEVDTRGAVE